MLACESFRRVSLEETHTQPSDDSVTTCKPCCRQFFSAHTYYLPHRSHDLHATVEQMQNSNGMSVRGERRATPHCIYRRIQGGSVIRRNAGTEITRLITATLVDAPAAHDAMLRVLARGATRTAVWNEVRLALFCESEPLRPVRTALVVYAAGHAPATIDGYQALLSWAADRTDWQAIAHALVSGDSYQGSAVLAHQRSRPIPL